MSETWLPDVVIVGLAILATVGLGAGAGVVHRLAREHLDRQLDRKVLRRLRRGVRA